MNSNNPYAKYKAASFTNDNQVLLLIAVIDEGIKKLYEGKKHINEGNIEGRYWAFLKAQEIFSVLKDYKDVEDDNKLLQSFNNFLSSIAFKIGNLQDASVNQEEVLQVINTIKDIRNLIKDLAKAEELI